MIASDARSLFQVRQAQYYSVQTQASLNNTQRSCFKVWHGGLAASKARALFQRLSQLGVKPAIKYCVPNHRNFCILQGKIIIFAKRTFQSNAICYSIDTCFYVSDPLRSSD